MKLTIIIAILIVTLVLVLIAMPVMKKVQYNSTLDGCIDMPLGASITELKPVIGTPRFIMEMSGSDGAVEMWFFDIPRDSEKRVIWTIDTIDSVLIGKDCGERGFVAFDIQFIIKNGYDSLRTVLHELLTVQPGMNADEVAELLGEPEEIVEDENAYRWLYPKKWLGYRQPIIVFDDENVVTVVEIDKNEFVLR